MKLLFLAATFAVCLFMLSCNNGSANQKNISVSRDIFQGIETGDSTKLSAIAPDAVDHASAMGDVKNGDSIKAYLLDLHNHFRDLKFEILGNATDGDYVYTWTKMTGTPTDSSMHLPVGIPVSIKSVEIIKYNNGKAVEHWTLNDQQDMMMLNTIQSPGTTTVKVTMDDTSKANNDSTVKK